MRALLRWFVVLPWWASLAFAQVSFLDVTPTANPYFVTSPDEDYWANAVAPADVDGDGDLDLAVIGTYVVYNVSAEDRLVILRNDGPAANGSWQFAVQPVPLGAVSAGASDLAWGDFDGDGDHDLATGSDGATVVYRNVNGTLAPLANALPGYWEDSSYSGAYDLRSLTWADVDNDGDVDLLIPSVFDPVDFTWSTKLLRNDGSDGAGGWLFSDTNAALDPTVHAQSAWADDDGDGDLDLFLANVDPYLGTGFVRRYANAAGSFTAADLIGIKVQYGLADWGDYDADGDLDIVVAGNIEEVNGTFTTVLRVYRNDGGPYTELDLIAAPNADWLDLHAATWADYDSDGDIDLLITGSYVTDGEIVGKSEVYANSSGAFTPLGLMLPAPISSIGRGGSFTWLDLDGDGDLDYLVAGAYYVPGGNGLVEARMRLYRNQASALNSPPSVPQGLAAVPGAQLTTLSWLPALDDHTPSTALTYDLEVRRAGATGALVARLPEPGGVSAVTSWELVGLAPGQYVWKLAAVDAAFAGSSRATGTFTISAPNGVFADGFEAGSTTLWSQRSP